MRVVVAALRERGVVVGGLQAAGVQVQCVLEEGGAGVAQVRAARPPPGRHGAQRRRRHHVAQRQRLLQQRAHRLLPRNKLDTIEKWKSIMICRQNVTIVDNGKSMASVNYVIGQCCKQSGVVVSM